MIEKKVNSWKEGQLSPFPSLSGTRSTRCRTISGPVFFFPLDINLLLRDFLPKADICSAKKPGPDDMKRIKVQKSTIFFAGSAGLKDSRGDVFFVLFFFRFGGMFGIIHQKMAEHFGDVKFIIGFHG